MSFSAPSILAFAACVIIAIAKPGSVCTQAPYSVILPFSNYAPAEAFCSSHYPVKPVIRTTTTTPVTTVTVQAKVKRATSSKSKQWKSCSTKLSHSGGNFFSTACSCIEVPVTTTVTRTARTSTVTETSTPTPSTCNLPGSYPTPSGCGSGDSACGTSGRTPSNYVLYSDTTSGGVGSYFAFEYNSVYFPYPGSGDVFKTDGSSLDDCFAACNSAYGANGCNQVIYQHSTGTCTRVNTGYCQGGYCGDSDYDTAFAGTSGCQYFP